MSPVDLDTRPYIKPLTESLPPAKQHGLVLSQSWPLFTGKVASYGRSYCIMFIDVSDPFLPTYDGS